MKKNSLLTELNLDQLEKKKKLITGALIGLGSVILIASIVIIYIAVTTKKLGLIAVCFGSFITLLPLFINMQQINSEIKRRATI